MMMKTPPLKRVYGILSLALVLILSVTLTMAQESGAQGADNVDRGETGGAPTLEDILARQRGERINDDFRRENTGDPANAAGLAQQLGTLGGASDPELWRALRFDSAEVTTHSRSPAAQVLVQDGGMQWLQWRTGPVAQYGGWGLVGTLGLLVFFLLVRGRIPIEGGRAGRTVTRFGGFERFGHWLLAGSFILLGISGLITLFGRSVIIPLFGKETNAVLLAASKWVHNNVAWPFMIALVIIFIVWVWHNIPNRTDLTWLRMGGGIFSNAHPPAKKFNAGQKLIFWSVIVLGGSISVSGIALLFPFELPLFAQSFAWANEVGLTAILGLEPLPTQLSPQEEMQYAQIWHAIGAFALMAIILAHIYIGTVGMEGAFDAMGSGEVDEAWAHQHHSLWLDEVKAKEVQNARASQATPAE